MDTPSDEALRAAHCWEADDLVTRRPAMTAFRRRTRLHQARWREANGHPIGTQPLRPRPGVPGRPVGSRIPLAYGLDTGANLLTPGALAAARARAAHTERHQSFDHQRLWADLLSSAALAFNLFGDLAADLDLADRAVHAWWPDVPGTVAEIRFAHSPGRLDPAYLDNLSAFDVAVVLDQSDGSRGILAIDIRYHERSKREQPKPRNLPRYLEVAERSGVFVPDYLAAVSPTDLLETWLEHLVMLSMLQHPGGEWSWGRYAAIGPAGNTDLLDAHARYEAVVADPSSFRTVTLESLLEADALPKAAADALRARYL